MLRIFLALIILQSLIMSSVFAQIYDSNNFISQNQYLLNPAHTGDKNTVAGFMSYRNHLSNIPEAPKSLNFGVHSPVFKKINLGLLLYSQTAGVIKQNSLRIDYSYRTKISKNQSLAFGINTGYYSSKINYENVFVIDVQDPVLLTDYNMQKLFFAGAGISYKYKNLELDASVPIMYRTDYDTVSNYFVNAAYNFHLSENIKLTPAINGIYRKTSNPTARASLMFQYKEIFNIEAAYKTNNSLVVSAGVFVNKLGIAYAYETNSGTLAYFGGATHEIMLSYGFNKTEKRVPKDTLINVPEYDSEFSRTSKDKSYEEFVLSNNYSFYNTTVYLTDSMHIIAAVQKDSISVADSIKQHPVQELKKHELDILQKGVLFEINSAVLTQESREYLNSVAELMKENTKIKILITGYTCDLGSKETNEKYSLMRAESVKYYLKQLGIDEKRITTDAKADAQPVVPNDSEQHREANRRVGFSIIRE